MTPTAPRRWLDEQADHPRYADTGTLWMARHGNRYASNELIRILKDLYDRSDIG